MAVPEQTPYIEHIGNGVTTSFSLGFQYESKDHLIVLVDEIEPPIATWNLTGGNVVFTTAPAAGKKITVQRNTPFGRTENYQSFNNSFRPQTVNIDFDRIWWKLQELGIADWILGARIDALKNYVDRKDDELKAYLMEEIRKQGVALDQLDEYYNYLMERLAQIAVDKGWDASFVIDGDKNQHEINQEQLDENTAIRSEISTVESYIVYAEKYGASLNEAMAAINTEFAGNRVRVYVPSNFPVTGTVDLNIDCDLDLSTLQVQSDVGVLFNPVVGWNGTSTACEIFCNKFSILKGWDLLKDLGVVSIQKTTFYDVGNEAKNTSADYFVAFHIANRNIKKLDLFHPTLINSYVKPNGVIGDLAGYNRCIIIEGYYNIGDSASDINIYYPHCKNLKTEEDADGLVINSGNGTQLNPVFNIDIYGGYFEDVHKRAIKIIGTTKNSSGIRFHGDMRAKGAGLNPLVGIDISGYCHVEWNGIVKLQDFAQGLYVWGGAHLTGTADFEITMPVSLNIAGNATRGFVSDNGLTPAARPSFIDINSIKVVGGYESMRIREGQTIKMKRFLPEAIRQIMTIDNSTLTISEEMQIDFKASSSVLELGNFVCIITGDKKIKINKITGAFNQAIPATLYTFFLQNINGFEVDSVNLTGNIHASTFFLSNCTNTKIRKAKSASPYLVSSNNGGENLLLSECMPGSSGLINNDVNNPITNIVELNTLTF